MTHFGILCPPTSGHLNPMTALGYELQRRGHRVTLFGVIDVKTNAVAAELDFWVLGENEYPSGSVAQSLSRLGELSGWDAVRYTINQFTQGADILLQYAPRAIRKAEVEALLIDQCIFEGGSIAEFLNLPFITVSSALMLNPETGIPPAVIPWLAPWDHDLSWQGYLRNAAGYAALGLFGIPLLMVINKYRQQWKLPPYSIFDNVWSQLAQISQQPCEFEFPRNSLPRCFHFTGPYLNSGSREPIAFPFERLTGQPLIYASLGTLQNGLLWIFRHIARACAGIDAQLVISLGGSSSLDLLQELPGSPIVVGYAPQLELLQRTTLTITHAGLNTVLESLSNGVPMVAIPITNDIMSGKSLTIKLRF